MKSIKTKIMKPVYTMAALFIVCMVTQMLTVGSNFNHVKIMKEKHFFTVTKADELKLSVVQVQQWLTDVSAARGADGYADGLKEAAVYAERVRQLVKELKEMNPDDALILDEILRSFEPYYVTGIEMAEMYIKYGSESGNHKMNDFDIAAGRVNQKVDSFILTASENISKSIQNIELSIVWSILLAIAAMLSSVFLCAKSNKMIGRTVMKPIIEIRNGANQLAEGNLNIKIAYESNDEIGELSRDMHETISTLNKYISGIRHYMKEMEQGNLAVTMETDFKGDFIALRDSIVNFNGSIRAILAQIHLSSDQVAQDSGQFCASSQMLAQGAEEQSQGMAELSANIETISGQVKINASTTNHANELAEAVGNEALLSKKQMEEMILSMKEISQSSNEIGKVIKTIEGIAHQTNILALNAAVEAARAGESGKGFVVVSDEVRNLASQSAKAVQSTASLIERSMLAVKNGSDIANTTSQTLVHVTDGVKKIQQTMKGISTASNKQADAVEEINKRINQVSDVIQTISAAAEESEAAGEELSEQSQTLKELVGKFHLAV